MGVEVKEEEGMGENRRMCIVLFFIKLLTFNGITQLVVNRGRDNLTLQISLPYLKFIRKILPDVPIT